MSRGRGSLLGRTGIDLWVARSGGALCPSHERGLNIGPMLSQSPAWAASPAGIASRRRQSLRLHPRMRRLGVRVLNWLSMGTISSAIHRFTGMALRARQRLSMAISSGPLSLPRIWLQRRWRKSRSSVLLSRNRSRSAPLRHHKPPLR